ncbi:MAG: hypothetical protein FWD69_05655 [Polyangiaceae bacterium]|nr:hypothetical protein [Polyangiaceae bacterium]
MVHTTIVRLVLTKTAILSCTMHAAIGAAFFIYPHVPTPVDPPPRISGDTFELPAPEISNIAAASASPDNTEAASTAAPDDAHRAADRNSLLALRTAAQAPTMGSRQIESGPGTLYGAVGDRSATNLATTFARSFAQTASADPAWQRAPLGAAGQAVVTLTLDETGHIDSAVVTGSPSAALASSIDRTMALMKSRSFVAPTRITKVHLIATVMSGAAGDDGLDGDHFGLSARGNNASFVLPIGKRIQLQVK